METSNHTIRKQSLELNIKGINEDVDLENKVVSLYYEKIVPVIEKVLDELNVDGKVIRYDKIEIDTGSFELNTLMEELAPRVEKILRQELKKAFHEISSDKPAVAQVEQWTADREVLLFYLEYGYLPWWGQIKSREELEKTMKVLLAANDEQMLRFLSIHKSDHNITSRLAYQFSKEIILRILVLLFPSDYERFTVFVTELAEALKKLPAGQYIIPGRDEIFRSLFIYLSSDKQRSETTFLVMLLLKMTRTGKEEAHDFGQLIEDISKLALMTDKIYSSSLPDSVMILLNKPEVRDALVADTTTGLINGPGGKGERPEPVEEKERAEELEVYISNAGLILLWPFLERFFEDLHYTENKKFLSKDHQRRAALLLQYMATGKKRLAEHDMVLNKILVGLDLYEPLPRKLILRGGEKKNSIMLLRSVIEQWPVLKKTSVPGLREAFINREGRVTRKEKSYSLKVHQKAYDILLDKLPWPVTIVKLPWMQKPLYIEW